MRWLLLSTGLAGGIGLGLLAWVGPAAWPAVLPLAALAAAPLLPTGLRPGVRSCRTCRGELDQDLTFCGRCAAPAQ